MRHRPYTASLLVTHKSKTSLKSVAPLKGQTMSEAAEEAIHLYIDHAYKQIAAKKFSAGGFETETVYLSSQLTSTQKTAFAMASRRASNSAELEE